MMMGKVSFNIIFLMTFINSVLANENIFDIESWLKEIKAQSSEEFLSFEKSNDETHKKNLLEIKQKCMDTDYLIDLEIDQTKCFSIIKNAKLNYLNLKFNKKNKVILESFNSFKLNMNKLHQQKLKQIQSFSPEDDQFFEL